VGTTTEELTMKRTEIVHVLNDLVEIAKDGVYGFRTCATHASGDELRQLPSSSELPERVLELINLQSDTIEPHRDTLRQRRAKLHTMV
jgi:hypothetical protein